MTRPIAIIAYCLWLGLTAFMIAAHGQEVESDITSDIIRLETPEPSEWTAERLDHLEQAVFNLETLVLRLYIGDAPGSDEN